MISQIPTPQVGQGFWTDGARLMILLLDEMMCSDGAHEVGTTSMQVSRQAKAGQFLLCNVKNSSGQQYLTPSRATGCAHALEH